MPLIFSNGGTPVGNNAYQGVTYTSALQLYNHLSSILIKAGWLSTGSSGNTYYFKCFYGNLQSQNIHFIFTDNFNNTTQGRLGFYIQNHTNTSSHYIEFTTGKENTIFIAANNYAVAIANFPFVGTAEIIHLGYLDNLERVSTEVIQNATYAYAYIGKAFTVLNNDSVYPRTISSTKLSGYDYCNRASDNDSSLGSHFAGTASISIASAIPLHTIQNINSGARSLAVGNLAVTTTNTNTAYFGNIGNNDERSNLPIIAPYYYLEGEGAVNIIGNLFGSTRGIGVAPTLNFRGTVPFLATGFSHLPSFSQWNTSSGHVYITGDVSFQGMRIA